MVNDNPNSKITEPGLNFFQEACQHLCGNLEFAVAVGNFFNFLVRHVPAVSFSLGRSRLDKHTIDVICHCDEGGAHMIEERIAYPPLALSQMDDFYFNDLNNPDGVFITGADNSQTKIISLVSDSMGNPVRPPFFFMRMIHDKKRIGSATFACAPERPFSPEDLDKLRSLRTPLLIAMSNYFQYKELKNLKDEIWRENQRLRRQLEGDGGLEVVGAAGGLRQVMEKARLAGPVAVPVLITGETGTGKELIARTVHSLSPRRGKPFVAVNCGGIPPSLIDSELFGHVKGSFTGAVGNHVGRFQRADGGTLFLDEVGELPLEVQARLLRVLQERVVERVGDTKQIPVDFRLITATNRDLEKMVEQGTFREDLYYRLKVFPIHLPPLRERKQDIPILVEHLLRSCALRFGITPPDLAPGEMAALVAYDWPGNVRELQNSVEEALVLRPRGPLTFRREKAAGRPSGLGDAPPALDEYLGLYFTHLLGLSGGKINGPGGAAALAGLKPNTLRAKLVKLNIPFGREA